MTWKTNSLEGCSWFKFNNLRLTLDMASKFYKSVAKWLKLRGRKFLETNSYVCRSYWENIGRDAYLARHPQQKRWVVPQHLVIHSCQRMPLKKVQSFFRFLVLDHVFINVFSSFFNTSLKVSITKKFDTY